MWDLPGPGLEPVSPALAGRFLATVPPGKSLWRCLERVFADVKKMYAKKRLHWGRVGSQSSTTGVLIRRGEDTQRQIHTGKKPRDHRGGDGRDAATSQGALRMASNARGWKRRGVLPWKLQRGRSPADTLTSDFCPPECDGIDFCCLNLLVLDTPGGTQDRSTPDSVTSAGWPNPTLPRVPLLPDPRCVVPMKLGDPVGGGETRLFIKNRRRGCCISAESCF